MALKYSEEHEWIDVDGDVATIGISTYAAEQLGDVVFVELPDTGKTLAKGDEAAVVESVKAASEIYAPVSGEVVAVNEVLNDAPDTVNASAEKDGWFLKIKMTDASETENLMDAGAYKTFVDNQ